MATSPYRSWVEISRSQIASNYQVIQKAVGPGVTVMPVVKADAYRHGAVEVSRVLTNEGAKWLAVSNVEEGVALRLAGIDARILVMADFLPVGRLAMCEHGLTPVIHAIEDLRELNELGSRLGSPIPFHLKIDSGMCRLGTRATAAEIARALKANPYVTLEGLMTHFASVADFTKEQTNEQTIMFFRSDRRAPPTRDHSAIRASFKYRRHCISQEPGMGQHGPTWSRNLWLRFTRAGFRARQPHQGQAGHVLEGCGSDSEGDSARRDHWVRRNVPGIRDHANSSARGGLCGWYSASIVEPGTRDRVRSVCSHTWRCVHGFDDDRCDPVS